MCASANASTARFTAGGRSVQSTRYGATAAGSVVELLFVNRIRDGTVVFVFPSAALYVKCAMQCDES